MSANNQLAKKPNGGALALPELTTRQLDLVRDLATDGCREHTIRRALSLSPREWKLLREDSEAGDLSPLALALEEGRAEGAGEVVAFMKNKMRNEGSERAAEWLATNIFQLNRGDGNNEAPRVQIFINAALSPDDYGKVVQVRSDLLG